MRAGGILLPISSLPSSYGIGAFSKEAYEFVDKLADAGQAYWQILPLGPTGYGDSPYQSFSTFAGNPYFIDLESLVEQGLLTSEECAECDFGQNPRKVDYAKIFRHRLGILRRAFEKRPGKEQADLQAFCERQGFWLNDYALFMALKDYFGGSSWERWEDDIRMRKKAALNRYRNALRQDIEFYQYIQYLFMTQWEALRRYANKRGVQIIGDIPIYVAFDSADAWANPELFLLDDTLMPLEVAGCPPDTFSTQGQLWGNPLYRWDVHKQDGYGWWFRRIDYCRRLYNLVRIDHFRGFDAYYSIPRDAPSAALGHWEKGPGMDFFRTLKERLGHVRIIAEDLGFVTESVIRLIEDTGYPNMKILQFAFDSREAGNKNDFLPHNFRQNCVVYTGTHDNETIKGWYENLSKEDRNNAELYMDLSSADSHQIHWKFIRMAMLSVSELCVIPMQDYIGLGNEARMNAPSTLGGNWQWRMLAGEFTDELEDQIRRLTKISGRMQSKT